MSVRNTTALFLALSTLALLAGCGSNGPKAVPPPSGGFSNSNFNGTYVFSSTGTDVAGGFLAIAGALTADGSGHISGGTMDLVGVDVVQSGTVAQSITGTYNVGVDGRGQFTVTSSAGSIKFDFVLTSSSHGLITEYDGNGSGSGTIDAQTAVTTLTQLQGPYAFSLAGVDLGGNPDATAGAFTLDSAGNITAGVQDFNDFGIPYAALTINPVSAVVLGSGTGPGTIQISTSTFNTLTFDFYPVDATHLKLIETDSLPILVGDAYTQTGASIPAGQVVFTMAGLDLSFGPVAAGGVMTSVGDGNFTGGLEDLNDAGTVSTAQIPFTGIPVAGGPGVGGRLVVNLTGFVPATQIVIYPSSGGVLMLETDSAALTAGAAFAQHSTTLAASQGYGLNLSAINIGSITGAFEEDDIAEFVTTSAGFTGIVDLNDEGSITFKQSLNGSYPFAVDSTGRGGVNTNFFNYFFYVVDGNTFLILESDTNQIGVGTFQLQSTPTAAAARPAITMFRPAVRARGALRRNQ